MAERSDFPAEFYGFEPVWGRDSRALILGTWPSPKSRAQGFYYGHPQNRFWPLLARLTGNDRPVTIEEKKSLILNSGLALWDTLAHCTIVGARDETIEDPVPNDIAGLLARAPVEAIFCNGAAAWKFYEKFARPLTGIKAVKLPSTSPANAAWSLDRLQEAWGQALGPYLVKKP
jgi:TDG/mug DNA glycosylase family protein